MFNKLSMIACLVAGALTLGGCPSPSDADPAVTKFLQSVQKYCGWVEPASSAANIVATLAAPGAIPALTTIEAAARGLCATVQNKSARKGGVMQYRGVVLQGHFSRR